MSRAYIAVKPCGCATAILVNDEKTTAAEVAMFYRDRGNRTIENVTLDEGRARLKRCTHTVKGEK